MDIVSLHRLLLCFVLVWPV